MTPRAIGHFTSNKQAADARKRLGAIRRVAHLLDNQGIMMAYKAFVRSKIKYGNLVYWGAANTNLGTC